MEDFKDFNQIPVGDIVKVHEILADALDKTRFNKETQVVALGGKIVLLLKELNKQNPAKTKALSTIFFKKFHTYLADEHLLD